MALKNRLLKNFEHLNPEERRLVVDFSERLLKQSQAGKILLTGGAPYCPRMDLVNKILDLNNQDAIPIAQEEHDQYIYSL